MTFVHFSFTVVAIETACTIAVVRSKSVVTDAMVLTWIRLAFIDITAA